MGWGGGKGEKECRDLSRGGCLHPQAGGPGD